MPLVYIKILFFFVALASAALFSFFETAFTALRLFKVKELAQKTKRYHRLFHAWEQMPQRILITVLMASNLAHVLSAVLIADLMQHFLGDTGFAFTVGVLIATTLILIFGEIIPKSYAKTNQDFFIQSMLWLIGVIYVLFYPFVTFLLWIANRVTTKLGTLDSGEKSDVVSEKEIEFLIDYSDKQGEMTREKTQMLQNIFSLEETLAKEVMVPATDMVVINVTVSLKEALSLFAQCQFTRIPVYEGKEDHIIGIIHQKDLFNLLFNKEEKPLRAIVKPILFVPDTKRTNQLLREFLEKQIHMAILLDEFGMMKGLVTLEDILEEIVGPICDEHEKVPEEIAHFDKDRWVMDAKVPLDEAQKTLGITLEVEDSVTLAGFLAEKLQHLPRQGDNLNYKGHHFKIKQADERRVYQVLVSKDKIEKFI